MRSPCSATESRPRTPQLEKTLLPQLRQQRRPTQPKITKKKKKKNQTHKLSAASESLLLSLCPSGTPAPWIGWGILHPPVLEIVSRNFPLVPAPSSSAPQAHHLSLKRDSSVSHTNKYINIFFNMLHSKHHPTLLCNACFPPTPLPLIDLDYIRNLCSQQNS